MVFIFFLQKGFLNIIKSDYSFIFKIQDFLVVFFKSYSMRNGVLGVFGEIVAKVLNKDNLDIGMKKSREGFLDRLEVNHY